MATSCKVEDNHAALTVPERLGKNDIPRRNAWISMGRGNRRYLLGKLEVFGDGNLRNFFGGKGLEEEDSERECWKRAFQAQVES